MDELQKLACDILETIEREDFEYDYKHGGYKKSTVAKFIQNLNQKIR